MRLFAPLSMHVYARMAIQMPLYTRPYACLHAWLVQNVHAHECPMIDLNIYEYFLDIAGLAISAARLFRDARGAVEDAGRRILMAYMAWHI